jgi:energy-coupling factor transporter ATP-binding protein EcfA2
MSLPTPTKKGLVDFLWEWGENNGDWGKLLVCHVVGAEAALAPTERQSVFDYFLQSAGLKTGLPPLSIPKPVYNPTGRQLELISLSDIRGVNRLAKDQVMNFGKNLTVVYGENGSGKTGYGRILKALGFSYDKAIHVYCNVYDKPEPQNATIRYRIESTEQQFNWNGKNSNDDLSNISVFNNHCVSISLTSGRSLLVSPIGFHLFALVTQELSYLMGMLEDMIRAHPTTATWASSFSSSTPQQAYLQGLKNTSSKSQLDELSLWADQHEAALKQAEEDLAALNRTLLETTIRTLSKQSSELDALCIKIRKLEALFSSDSLESFCAKQKEIILLNGLKKSGIGEVASRHDVAFYQSKEFQHFISAAENYIRLIAGDTYPEEDKDVCIYCRQPLIDEKARELIGSYRRIMNDNSEERLKKLNEEVSGIKRAIAAVDKAIQIHLGAFGNNADNTCIQPKELLHLSSEIERLQMAAVEGNIPGLEGAGLDCLAALALLESRSLSCKAKEREQQELLKAIDIKEGAIRTQIAELKDRQLLNQHKAEVLTLMHNKWVVHKLLNQKSSLQTTALSRKTTQAREELVSTNFNDIFQSELKEVRKSQIKVELDFGTEKGQSKMTQAVGMSYALQEILSEGEQKAIALAEFLTELQLDHSKAPVIFDDPVNSLDHHLIDDVGRRLIKLSKERQVVIFTHSVLLYNFLLYCLNGKHPTFKKEIDALMYDVTAEQGRTGLLTSSESGKNSVTYYTSRIKSLLHSRPKNLIEADTAALGYGYLRSAIEISVENEMLSGTVVRYQKNVMLMNFGKLKTTLIEAHKAKVYEIFERCCAFLPGHSNPVEIATEPTLSDLTSDFVAFEEIRKAFQN